MDAQLYLVLDPEVGSSLDDEYSVTCVTSKTAWYSPFLIWSRGGARCTERSFPTNCCSSLRPMWRWAYWMYKRVRISQSFCSRRVTIPASMYIVQPTTSCMQVQSPSPARSFKLSPSYWYLLVMMGWSTWGHILFRQKLGVISWSRPAPQIWHHPYNSQYGWVPPVFLVGGGGDPVAVIFAMALICWYR